MAFLTASMFRSSVRIRDIVLALTRKKFSAALRNDSKRKESFDLDWKSLSNRQCYAESVCVPAEAAK